VIPIKQGQKGSTHEKAEATPETPDINASTGIIQQNETATAVNNPVLTNFLLFIIFDGAND